MPCYHPIPALRSHNGGPWTLYPKSIQRKDGSTYDPSDATIPCGKCLGCRTRIQLEWTLRCVHEARQYKHNQFVTLTYDDEHLPHELVPHHLTTFFKRLRNHINHKIRYLACGEYGDRTLRPHYHANIFNLQFEDQVQYSQDLYTSKTLDRIWGHGSAKLAPFTPATAGYVAGYITQHGRRTYYGPPDGDGVVQELAPPFKRQSTRPALGRTWLENHPSDVQQGYVILDGQKHPLPRYYKKLLDKIGGDPNMILGGVLASPRKPTDKFDKPRLEAAEHIHKQHVKRKGARDL